MTPYYQDDAVTIYHGDCRELLPQWPDATVVTDPPFNVGYRYASYADALDAGDYRQLLSLTCRAPSVVVHYPEDMFLVADAIGMSPTKVAAWVYNAHTPRKWRMVAWFGPLTDFGLLREPYKNPTDGRVARRMSRGSQGTSLYDWWHVEQVKNVSAEKLGHPCQMPLDVMRRIIGVTPDVLVVDPFAGTGTTLRAAKDLGRKAIGIEIEERYCEIAAKRCAQEVLLMEAS